MIPLIKDTIAPGSIVLSDKWPAYRTLRQHSFTHGTVNHKENYVDPQSGVHTQTIESWNRQVSEYLSNHQVRTPALDGYLATFCIRGGKGGDTDRSRRFFYKLFELIGESTDRGVYDDKRAPKRPRSVV